MWRRPDSQHDRCRLGQDGKSSTDWWNDGATGWCLEIHDLLVSKLLDGREKDLEFAAIAIDRGMAKPETLAERLQNNQLESEELRRIVEARIRSLY